MKNLFILCGFIFYFFTSSAQIIFYKFPNINLLGFIPVLVISFFSIKKKWLISKKVYFSIAALILWLSLNAVYAFFSLHNNPFNIIKFYIIFVSLILMLLVKPNQDFPKALICIGVLQAIFVLAFEIYMWLNWNMYNYKPIRDWIGFELKIGDIYTRNGWFWNIQLAGNSIMPISLFCAAIQKFRFRKLKILTLFTLSAGSIFSGHLAFWLAICVFLLLLLFFQVSHGQKIIVCSFAIVASCLLVSQKNFHDMIHLKHESSIVKYEQANLLIKTLCRPAVDNLLIGIGLGSSINEETENRDYHDKRWFELQFLYAAVQIGFPCFLLFLIIHLYLIKNLWKSSQIIAYFSYILYGSSNPYAFDSSHVLILLAISGLNFKKEILT